MQKINYKEANALCDGANRFFTGYAVCRFDGIIDKNIKFIEDYQLKDEKLWKRFIKQFKEYSDTTDVGWRGEYWGKMMRGACFIYSYDNNSQLYEILTHSVEDMLGCMEKNGRISSYTIDKEFTGWDLWCRKYVLLGLEYYLEICVDDFLSKKIVECLCCQMNYIISKIGLSKEGKLPINDSTNLWRGLNSSSVLEAVVRLYNITKEQRYLDFAEYIVNEGGTSIGNIFKIAFEGKLYPYQYPITKAYEMISCFEGLIEFYRVTKTDWQRKAVINFADQILKSDFTVIGGSGCTNELFDHSSVRQANTNNGDIMQETCVTVTLMEFFYQMTIVTGNSVYADAFECSLYNAYFGSLNTEKRIGSYIQRIFPKAIMKPLPFDSYSPLTAGTRGNAIGGLRLMSDSHYYGCCACIGSAGAGLVHKAAFMRTENGIVINLYIPGTAEIKSPLGNSIKIFVDTEYPCDGRVKIRMSLSKAERFYIYLRNPEWSKNTLVCVNSKPIDVTENYICICQKWESKDEIEMTLDMRTQALRPIPYDHDILMTRMIGDIDYMVSRYDEEDPKAKYHVALRRGPLIMAVDSQLGYDADNTFDIKIDKEGYVDASLVKNDYTIFEHLIELKIPLMNNETFRVTDYASSGKLWNKESKIAAWIKIPNL